MVPIRYPPTFEACAGPGESLSHAGTRNCRAKTGIALWIENEALAAKPIHSWDGLRPMMDWRAREWTAALLCQFHHDLLCGLIKVCDAETANLAGAGRL